MVYFWINRRHKLIFTVVTGSIYSVKTSTEVFHVQWSVQFIVYPNKMFAVEICLSGKAQKPLILSYSVLTLKNSKVRKQISITNESRVIFSISHAFYNLKFNVFFDCGGVLVVRVCQKRSNFDFFRFGTQNNTHECLHQCLYRKLLTCGKPVEGKLEVYSNSLVFP